jgi:hypothetical protein
MFKTHKTRSFPSPPHGRFGFLHAFDFEKQFNQAKNAPLTPPSIWVDFQTLLPIPNIFVYL